MKSLSLLLSGSPKALKTIITLLQNDQQTEVEVMLSLQSREGDILRVEGVAVPGLVQTVDCLLPPGPVHLAGQVIQGTIMAATNIILYRTKN